MKIFGKAINESSHEIFQRTGIKFSDNKDDKGRNIIENFDGDIDELAEKLHCISLEEANKKFSALKNE